MSETIKRALVLGCGGVAGAAWSIPVLRELENQLAWKANDADHFIGTSSGAIMAALLATGTTVEQLMASQQHNQCNCGWDHNHSSGAWYPPLPKLKLNSLNLLYKGFKKEVSALTAFCGLLPQGNLNLSDVENLIQSVRPDNTWPNKTCWLMAVDEASGERIAFGSDSAPAASLTQGVCASYAIPGWCPPVMIDSKTYLDGGIASPTSADLLSNSPVEEIIIIAPMASSLLDNPDNPLCKIERKVRKVMTRIVDKEVMKLQQSGKKVIRIEPSPKDLQAIGYNMMDPRNRLNVFNTSTASASANVSLALEQAC